MAESTKASAAKASDIDLLTVTISGLSDTIKELNNNLTNGANASGLASGLMGDLGDELLETVTSSLTSGFLTVVDTVASALSSFTDSLNTTINKIYDNSLKMNSAMQGAAESYKDMANDFVTTLAGQGYMSLESVVSNLNGLVEQGDLHQLEQRAFLKTMATEMNIAYSENARLTRILGQNLDEQNIAISYSLQEFLNANYETHQYLQEEYKKISDSLEGAMAMAGSGTAATNLNSTVQSWLGSLYSAGISDSTVEGLASELNKWATGDISSTSTGIGRLLLMSAANTGMDVGSLFNGGVTAESANTLLGGVAEYISSMSSIAGGSNVTMNQLAKTFGVDITDLQAIANLSTVYSGNSSIAGVINDYVSLNDTSGGKKVSTLIDNIMYATAANIATDEELSRSYAIPLLLSSLGGDSGTSLGSGVLSKLVSDIGDVWGSIVGIESLIDVLDSNEGIGADFVNTLMGTDADKQVLSSKLLAKYSNIAGEGSNSVVTSYTTGVSSDGITVTAEALPEEDMIVDDVSSIKTSFDILLEKVDQMLDQQTQSMIAAQYAAAGVDYGWYQYQTSKLYGDSTVGL